jgi:uncharacterized protein YPO0396
MFGDGRDLKTYCDLSASTGPETDPENLREAERGARAKAAEIATIVSARRRDVSAEIVSLEKDIAELRLALQQAGEPGFAAYLTKETKLLMRRLESAGMDARPLCDIVEINDPSWTAAAEALLGRDREAIFVDRNRILDATALFRDGRREFRGASLVSLNKLDSFRAPPPLGMFPSLFRTDDSDAMAFLQRRYGNVRLAATMDAFNQPGRALMQDGLYDDGLVRSHRSVDPKDHKIGKSAQADHFRALQDSFGQKGERLTRLQREEKLLNRALSALEILQQPDGDWLSDMLIKVRGFALEKAGVEAKIDAIDAAGDGGLRERLGAQKEFLKRKEDELKSIEERTRQYTIAVAVAEQTLNGGDSAEGSKMNLALAKTLYRQQRNLFGYRQGTAAYRERLAASRNPDRPPVTAPGQASHLEAAIHRKLAQRAVDASGRAAEKNRLAELDARHALHDFFNNPKFGVSSQVGPESLLLGEIKPWMNLMIEDIEGNELRRYEDKAREASERASVLFRGEFVNALNTRVSKMERDIESLNRSLKPHPFHNELYSFHRTAEAEFQPILRIIEISRISDDALDMLFKSNVPDDFPHKDTIKAVEQLLEDPDKDFSAFEDYRNFYAFEIHMEDVQTKARTRWETRRNTGSGAEQQVPLYVAIGASLAAVYGSAGVGRGPKGMSLALFDEAFSKMDGKNQRAMMSFYAALGLQVAIAAPLEKKPAIIGYMQTLVEVDRIGEQSTTDTVYVGQRARDEILAMNPEHLDDAEIAKKMAAE